MRWFLGNGPRWADECRSGSEHLGYVTDKRWLEAHVGHGFKAGRERDQGRLTEGGSDEADAQRQSGIVRPRRSQSEHLGRRYVDDGISGWAGDTRAGEQEVVGENQVCCPRWAISRRDQRVEMMGAQRGINVHTQQLIVLKSSVVIHSKADLGKGGISGVEGLSGKELFLAE